MAPRTSLGGIASEGTTAGNPSPAKSRQYRSAICQRSLNQKASDVFILGHAPVVVRSRTTAHTVSRFSVASRRKARKTSCKSHESALYSGRKVLGPASSFHGLATMNKASLLLDVSNSYNMVVIKGQPRMIAYYRFFSASRSRFAKEPAAIMLDRLAIRFKVNLRQTTLILNEISGYAGPLDFKSPWRGLLITLGCGDCPPIATERESSRAARPIGAIRTISRTTGIYADRHEGAVAKGRAIQ